MTSSGNLASFVGDSRLHTADIVIIVIYFVFMLIVGLWSSCQNRGSVGNYFLAGRSMHWIPVGASLFVSNIGSIHFIGMGGSGAAVGIGNELYNITSIFILQLLGWFFIPVYIASGITTMPEYLRKRFGKQRIRIYLAVLSLLLYIFTKISADLYAGAIFIEQALGWNIYAAIVLLLAIAAIFTITGGLTAVIWTDFIQTIIMIGGALALTAVGLKRVGGIEGLRHKYQRAIPNDTILLNTTCGYPRDDFWHLMRDPITGDIPWPGVFGIFLNSIWYWCADQVIVQRTLAARNYSHAKAGTILCGYFKFLPMFLITIPGMISRVLFPNEVACIDPEKCREICGNPTGCTNIAYPLLVLELMPNGARGLMLAVMLSALMSSLTSIFNSSSTLFTVDIWKKARKNAKDTELMVVSRLCVVVLVGVSIAWVPVIQASQGSQLFAYIQQIMSYLTPPICCVYLLAIFSHRINENGAFWSLIIGLVIGLTRFALEFAYAKPACGEEDTRPGILKNFHFLYFVLFLFFFTAGACFFISWLTKPLDEKYLHRLTYWTRHSKEVREPIDEDSVVEAEGVLEDDDSDVKEPFDQDDVIKAEFIVEDETSVKVQSLESSPITKCGQFCKTVGRWICGIEKMGDSAPIMSAKEKHALEEKLRSITETRCASLACNINSIVLMAIAVFVWAFFG